jgi:tol-pal system protein YbgF
MRALAAATLVLLLTTACGSSGHAKDAPAVTPPPAEFPVPAASSEANDARLRDLQTSMTELLERIDVVNDRLTKLEAAQADLTSSSERRVAERSVEPAPVVVRSSQPPAVAAAAPSMPPAAAPAIARPPAGPPARADIYTQYRNALVLYGKNRWADARNVFQQVFDAEPSGELADNALFWIGETYYAAGDYTNAMRYYGRVTKEYPNENKAPDALFKMGLAYVKTGDLAMARKTFEETLSRYPYATSAASAKAELARIRY